MGSSVQFSSVSQLCLTLCHPMVCSTPGLPGHHQLPDLAQTHARRLSDAIQPSHSLFSSSTLGTSPPGESIFQCPIFLPFILFMGFSRQECWSGLPFPSPVDHVLSELCTVTRPSWVAPHGMAHAFIVRQGCGSCDQFGSFSAENGQPLPLLP